MFPCYLFWLKLSCPTFLIICLAKGSMASYLLEFLVHGVDKSFCFHDVVHGSASLASDWWHMRTIQSKTIIPASIFVNENPNIGYKNFIVPCTIYRILSQPRWAENISLIYCWSFSYYFSCEFLCFLCHTFQLISSLWLSGWPIKLVSVVITEDLVLWQHIVTLVLVDIWIDVPPVMLCMVVKLLEGVYVMISSVVLNYMSLRL